jgi:hypothetical protein
MKVGSLELPPELAKALQSGYLRRERGSWPLKQDRDAFGDHLETELGETYDLGRIAVESAALPEHFQCDGVYGTSDPEFAGPGAIPDVTEFSQVLCFGHAGDGAPFCLDYRAGFPASVIWWDDVYWRRVAPDFSTFLDLFDIPVRPKGGG